MKEGHTHWAYKELEKKLAGAARSSSAESNRLPEVGTMFLTDPGMTRKIDKILVAELLPAVNGSLQGTRISIWDSDEISSQIETKFFPELTRTLIFLLEDPARPVASPDRPRWYIRGTLEASLFTYMLHFDLILELPKVLDLLRLLVLMEDPRLRGMPPTLSVDRDSYVVTFSWGRGGPYYRAEFNPDEYVGRKITEHLRIIEATDRLEADIDSEEAFFVLSSRILESYGDPDFEN
ncbi:MAG TPA: hypothetical protein VJX67_07175 [Blastocatellia bacterium]|nr:hypothetical protein [Blastocatellia bacterium]